MGLDLVIEKSEEEDMRVGTYCGVHRIRKRFFEMTLKYVQDKGIKNFDFLNRWIDFSNMLSIDRTINYDNVAKYQAEDLTKLCEQNLEGLQYFVLKSDCDGSWTHKECQSIANWMSLVLPYGGNLDEDTYEHYVHLKKFFIRANELESGIELC